MLRWLTRRLSRDARRRQIFRFWDGSQWRQCDPIEALLKLQSHPRYDYRIHPQMVDEGDQEATEITCQAVRLAFDVEAFNPTTGLGLTIIETLELLALFSVYLDDLKKSTGLPQISPVPSEPTSSGSATPITSDTSASGAIAIVPSSERPIESGAQLTPQ